MIFETEDGKIRTLSVPNGRTGLNAGALTLQVNRILSSGVLDTDGREYKRLKSGATVHERRVKLI
jgi:hypothetical protein